MQSSTQKGGHILAAYSTCIQVMKMTLSTFPFSDMLGSLEHCFGDWMQLYYITCLAIILNLLGHVAGQFTAAPPTCPGDTFTFRCNVTGDMNGITIWRVGGGSSECSLVHSTASVPVSCGVASPFTAAPGTGFGTSSTSFTSTLSGTATTTLNGTLVECFGPAFNRDAGNLVGTNTIQIRGQ